MERTRMAEREGFEPSVQLPVRILSKDVLSATQPPFLTLWIDSFLVQLAEEEGFEPPISLRL